MEMIPVESSHIARIGYHPDYYLRVVFHKGAVYDHYGVPTWMWHEFRKAPSKGKYYHQFIEGKFPIGKQE